MQSAQTIFQPRTIEEGGGEEKKRKEKEKKEKKRARLESSQVARNEIFPMSCVDHFLRGIKLNERCRFLASSWPLDFRNNGIGTVTRFPAFFPEKWLMI